eukprot:XP_011453213.1 PREDICTED: perlucin-like protein [Crassostrea gigas]
MLRTIGCLFNLLHIAFGCLIGWTPFNTSCYHLSGESTSWMDAMKMCEMRGAYLVHVDAASEDDFITSLMKTNGVHNVWLGGSDWAVEGQWVWEPEGTPFQYSCFSSGKPDNKNGENCLVKQTHHQYHWNDKDCDDHNAYICENRNNLGNPAVG